MPYKDKETQKNYNRDRMRKARQGNTEEGNTQLGSTRIEFIQKEFNDPYLIKDIEGAAALFKDRALRYERAYRYKLWKDGKPVPSTDQDTAAKLLQVCNALDKSITGLDGKKANLLSMVRYGVGGPTLQAVQSILSTT